MRSAKEVNWKVGFFWPQRGTRSAKRERRRDGGQGRARAQNLCVFCAFLRPMLPLAAKRPIGADAKSEWRITNHAEWVIGGTFAGIDLQP